MWFQFLMEIITKFDDDSNAKMDMINIYRYLDEKCQEEKLITEFEHNYTSNKAIYWYTRHSFFYSTLNKALRTQNIDIIYTFRFFIKDIIYQLRTENKIFLKNLLDNNYSIFYVYRGQKISTKELNIIRLMINQHISMNSFISATKNYDIAYYFSLMNEINDDIKRVLFKIEINLLSISSIKKSYSNISHLSYYSNEEEILFEPGCIFQIKNINYDENDTWIIDLLLCEENENDLKDIFNCIKNTIMEYNTIQEKKYNLYLLGNYLYECGQYNKSRKYFTQLLNYNNKDYFTIALCYIGLSKIAYKTGEFQLSNMFGEKCLSLVAENKIQDSVKFYTTIGSAQTANGQYDLAINSFKKAFQMLLTSNSLENNNTVFINVAAVTNNLGLIYQKQHDLITAKYYHKMSLEIKLKILPQNHPDIAVSYLNMFCIHAQEEKYDDANYYIQKAYEILIKCYPEEHKDIAGCYQNFGLIHQGKGDYTKAKEFYEKALNIRLKCLPKYHIEIAESYLAYGQLHLIYKDYSVAQKYLKNALDMKIKCLSNSQHPDLAPIYVLMATECRYRPNPDLDWAYKYYDTALNIYLQYLPTSHTIIKNIENDLLDILNQRRYNIYFHYFFVT